MGDVSFYRLNAHGKGCCKDAILPVDLKAAVDALKSGEGILAKLHGVGVAYVFRKENGGLQVNRGDGEFWTYHPRGDACKAIASLTEYVERSAPFHYRHRLPENPKVRAWLGRS